MSHYFKREILFNLLVFVIISIKAQDVAFVTSDLNFNGKVNVGSSTYLKFGPDGRLYVAELKGNIYALSIQKNADNSYEVSEAETITNIKQIPNHNDDGTSFLEVNRQVTSIYVLGTAENPIVYVASSDFRFGGPSGDLNLDTNSGIITKLTWNGSEWESLDLVRGLPRSEENHSSHGLEYANIKGKPFLLVSQGGNTNAGSPSKNFAWITEYALSAAVLAIDLELLDTLPVKTDEESGRKFIYDLPTLDDPTRENINGISDPSDPNYTGIDINDPWGGNDGLNQAKLVENGPVKILSAGYRNSYDLVITESGALYVTDNGGNNGWGGFPENEGSDGNVTNNYRVGEPGSLAGTSDNGEQSVDNKDHLTLVTENLQTYTFGSFYGGHPNPVRSNPAGAGLFTRGEHSSDPGDSNGNTYTDDWFRTEILSPDDPDFATQSLPVDWPPVPVSFVDIREGDMRLPSTSENSVEGDSKATGYINPDGPGDSNVLVWNNNSNGIDEYTATTFNGQMKGNLIAGKTGGNLHRVELNSNGTVKTFTENWTTGLEGNPLGIWCSGDSDPFPGSIWVATFNQKIKILTPDVTVNCVLEGEQGFDPLEDNDNDGFTNQDEIDNNTDLCSGGSQPNDFDGDNISDLNDNDDDDDGIIDAEDPFQLGKPFDIPVVNELFSDQLDLKGYLGLGITGLMNNGGTGKNYLDWVDLPSVSNQDIDDVYGGAVGGMTIYQTTGDAFENNQEKAYQYGVNSNSSMAPYIVSARMLAPFFNHSETESQGLFIGTGFQDNYIKLVLSGNTIKIEGENKDEKLLDLPKITIEDFSDTIDLFFEIDPSTGFVQASYTTDLINTSVKVGNAFMTTGKVLEAIQNSEIPLAVGFIGTADITDGYAANWDFLNVKLKELKAPENVLFRVNCGGPTIEATDNGTDWVTDIDASIVNNGFEVNTGNAFGGSANFWFANAKSSIKARTPFSIFDTERWDSDSGEEMKYTFDVVSPGDYVVRLYMRNSWIGTSTEGTRVFSVTVDGQSFIELKDIDLIASAGHKVATVFEIPINTNDNIITVDFAHLVENPLISGIEILKNNKGVWEYVNDGTDCSLEGFSGSCPQGRHEASYVQVGDKFILIGGRENNSNVNIYDPVEDSWTIGKDAPFPIHHFQAIEYNGLLLAVGAMTGNFPNEPSVDKIMIYDPLADQWYNGPLIPTDRVRGGAGCVVYNEEIYLMSGTTTGHEAPGWVTWLDKYNPKTNTWTKLADAPRARDHFHAAIVGNKLYAVAGRQSGALGIFEATQPEVDVYDFVSNTWATLPNNIPTERAGNTVAVIGNELIVIGGEREEGPAKSETEALNTITGEWRSLNSLNQGRHGSQAIVSNKNIWFVAGSPNRGGGKLQSQERFYFESPSIPSLNEITKSKLEFPLEVIVDTITEVNIENSLGNQAILIEDITIENNSNFKITPSLNLPFILSSKTSITFNVEYTGTLLNESATLQIQHSASNGAISEISISNSTPPSVDCSVPPTGLIISDISSSSATVSYDNTPSDTRTFELRAFIKGDFKGDINGGAVSYASNLEGSTSITINGLEPKTEYDFVLRALCANQTPSSSSTVIGTGTTKELVSISNDCNTAPTNLKLVSTTGSSATFSFDNELNNTRKFELRAYLENTFLPFNVNTNAVGYAFAPEESTEITINNLEIGNTYDFAIRALCSDQSLKTSAPSKPIRVTFNGESTPVIASLNSTFKVDLNLLNNEIIIYPCPVKNEMQIESQLEYNIVKIFTMEGREVASYKKQNQINLETLSSGIYFVALIDAHKKSIVGIDKIVKE